MRFLKFFTQSPDGLLHVDAQNQLAVVGSQLNNVVGPPIASTTTISPTYQVHHVTGTVAIATINPPYTGFQGTIQLIPDGAFTTTTAGNIGLASTGVVGKTLEMCFDGKIWYPSY